MIKNSEVIREVLTTMIDISSRKTTEGHAILVMDSLIKKLEERYDFLKHIEIKDTRFLEMDEPITVMSDIDVVKSNYVGEALYDIITTMNKTLGKEAGHFFIKELKNSIREEYYSTIKDMGLDLSLMQLEFEISELEKRLINTRRTD